MGPCFSLDHLCPESRETAACTPFLFPLSLPASSSAFLMMLTKGPQEARIAWLQKGLIRANSDLQVRHIGHRGCCGRLAPERPLWPRVRTLRRPPQSAEVVWAGRRPAVLSCNESIWTPVSSWKIGPYRVARRGREMDTPPVLHDVHDRVNSRAMHIIRDCSAMAGRSTVQEGPAGEVARPSRGPVWSWLSRVRLRFRCR